MKEEDIVKIVSDICPISGHYLERGVYQIKGFRFEKNMSGKKEKTIPYAKMALLHKIKDDSNYGWVPCRVLLPVEVEELI